MLKVALPRPTSDAVSRGAGAGPFRRAAHEADEDPYAGASAPLTRAQAADLQRRQPSLSPWRVVAAQVVAGALAAGLCAVFGADASVGASALYGAATAAIPAALMARGMARSPAGVSPLASALGVLGWSFVKIAASVFMLALAPRVVADLSWPALLVTLVLCLQAYWFALLWRGPKN